MAALQWPISCAYNQRYYSNANTAAGNSGQTSPEHKHEQHDVLAVDWPRGLPRVRFTHQPDRTYHIQPEIQQNAQAAGESFQPGVSHRMEIKPTYRILTHQPICDHRCTLNHHRNQHHPTRDQNTQSIYQEIKLPRNNSNTNQECRGRSPLPGFGYPKPS